MCEYMSVNLGEGKSECVNARLGESEREGMNESVYEWVSV